MKDQKAFKKGKHNILKKFKRCLAIAVVVLALAISPLNFPLGGKTIIAEAVGVGLIGGATTNSDFNNGVLSVGIHGGSAVSLDIAKTYYAQLQLPSSLGHLLEHPNIREHIKMKYSIPAPLLGFIPIKREVLGEWLKFNKDNNLIEGDVDIPINLSLAGVYRFTFEIDLEALDVNVPQSTYEFKINVGDSQLDLGLLEFSQSSTSLQFEHEISEEEEEEEEEVPVIGSTTSNASIVFLPSTSPPPVVDPTNPTEPYDPDPTDPTEPQDPPTGDTGQLTLDYVSSIDFGKQKIEGGKSIYNSTVLRPFIQVTDRRSENMGWAVTASLSEFSSEGREGTLSGSVITLKDGTAISAGNTEAPYAYKNVQLHSGGDANWVLWAEAETGIGTWIDRWYPSNEEASTNDNILMEVPTGAATVGKHQASITWTLTSAPSQ